MGLDFVKWELIGLLFANCFSLDITKAYYEIVMYTDKLFIIHTEIFQRNVNFDVMMSLNHDFIQVLTSQL